jgi:alanine dehydrogenase
MRIGVPREIKTQEYRVVLTPASVREVVHHGHQVLVDIAIDQGGCFETSHPTTHDAPTYIVDEVVHYCVANMPAAVARSSTAALNNATLPFVLALADKECRVALQENVHFRAGLNVMDGVVTHATVAEALGAAYRPAEDILTV